MLWATFIMFIFGKLNKKTWW
ncbi:hypothetical protein N8768_04155 [Flavobacteriaceae bacterium]|nr:hypothetical protein [Flavobacteriaceae bacterium]